MGKDSEIAWTDHTFNPWWGCARVSPGCEHCYAETLASRFGTKWGTGAERRLFGDKHWREPLAWNASAAKRGMRERVFCSSMADVFEDRRDLDAQRERLWALIAATPSLDWLLLTKRPQHIAAMLPATLDRANVWLGVTAEDQRRADERIPMLLACDAAVRFVSYEPALGPVDFTRLGGDDELGTTYDALRGAWSGNDATGGPRLDLVIVGGESGPGARLFDLAWARSAIAQCRSAQVPVFCKQLGAHAIDSESEIEILRPYHLALRDRAGRDMNEWPLDLRVRQMPGGAK